MRSSCLANKALRAALSLTLFGCTPRTGQTEQAVRVQPSNSRDRVHERMAEAQAAMQAHDFDRAGEILDRAEREATNNDERALIAYQRATLIAYRGDFEGAADVLVRARIPFDAPLAFSFHNSLIMLRTARQDLLGALIECERMVDVGQAGIWTADPKSRRMVLLKKYWHRAYLLRLVAAMSDGSPSEAARRYAEGARATFRELAAPIKDQADAVAVLDAFFAVQDGDGSAARAAARRVNVSDDDDVEDLYITQMALDIGGDSAGAVAVRKKIERSQEVYLAVPIIASWLQSDMSSAIGGGHAWSPRYPRGKLATR
jgi:hypothetical protein